MGEEKALINFNIIFIPKKFFIIVELDPKNLQNNFR